MRPPRAGRGVRAPAPIVARVGHAQARLGGSEARLGATNASHARPGRGRARSRSGPSPAASAGDSSFLLRTRTMAWGGLASESLLYLTAINWFGRGRHMMTVSTRANRSAPRWGAALACAIAVATPGRAHAANPLNSTDQTTASAQAACTSGDRDEFNIVPIIGGTSDIGIGVG